MFARLIVIVWILAGCGRLGFDDVASTDATVADTSEPDGPPREGVTVWAHEVTVDSVVKTVVIEVVDPTRTLVLCDFRTGTSGSGKLPACHLTGPTTVTVTVGVADPSLTVRLQVIELPIGTRVQRGDESVGSGDSVRTIALQPVDLATSFAVISRWTSLDVSGLDPRYAFTAQLRDAQTLELTRNDTGNTVHVAWQVVQLPGARVTSGLSTLPTTVITIADPLPNVDMSRAFIVMTSRFSSSFEADYLTRARVSNTLLALFRNDATSAIDIAWFIVEQPGVSVQSGMTATGSSLTANAALGTVVDPARTAVFLTASGGRAGNASDVEDTICTGAVMPTQLELRRNPSPAADVNAVIGWNVVTWPAP